MNGVRPICEVLCMNVCMFEGKGINEKMRSRQKEREREREWLWMSVIIENKQEKRSMYPSI